MALERCLGPEDDDLARHLLQERHVTLHCGDEQAAGDMLERLHVVVERSCKPSRAPLSLRIVHKQLARQVGRVLALGAGSMFLRKLLYHFPQFDCLFQYVVEELAAAPRLCEYCCDSEHRWLVMTLLDHRTRGEALDTSALQESIVSWKNLDRLITSKTGGLWILRRVIEQRPDQHARVASWLLRFPNKYMSSMSVDVVAQMLRDSPREEPVVELANAYLKKSLLLFERGSFSPLLHDRRFAPVLEALYGLGGDSAARIDATKYDALIMYAEAAVAASSWQEPCFPCGWEEAASAASTWQQHQQQHHNSSCWW